MKKTLVHYVMQSLMGIVLLPGIIGVTQESEQTVKISLVRPGEGETFYAGPTSLLYNIPIHGWVESDLYRSEEIKVVLAIYQNSGLVSTQEMYSDENGEFEFYTTVNPKGSTENFPATQADCSSYCHYLSELVLPAGEIILELTAVDPAGNKDSFERHIIVDRSDYAIVPVQVVLTNSKDSDFALESIPVTASTRLYMWRSRNFLVSTDDYGRAEIRVEALAESPTHYWLQVEPSVVNGVLYYSEEPVEVFLPPGAYSSSPVILDVRTKTGKINGKVVGIDKSLVSSVRVLAISPTDGLFYSEQISSLGDFVFDDIPLREYIIVPDLDMKVPGQGVVFEAEMINLMETPTVSIEFTMNDIDGYVLQGDVRGDNNQLLPFAWITNEKIPITKRAMIKSSRFEIYGLHSQSMTFIVNAPGYFSRAYTLGPSFDQLQALSPMLVRQPDTRNVSWGNGEIVIPPESVVELSENSIRFKQGWLWGYNHQSSEITIQHDVADIVIKHGRFAIESLPNRKNWLYLIEGNATIHPANGMPSVTVNAGEMITLIPNKMPVPIPIDQTVVTALYLKIDQSSQSVWEPTLNARIRDYIARIGVNSVQMITFITYGLILISIVGFPFVALYLRLMRRNQPINEEIDETNR